MTAPLAFLCHGCHAGHDADNLSEGCVWCLDTQIQHKMQLIRDHVLAPGKPPAVLLAHSIGSYMTLQVLLTDGLAALDVYATAL